MKTLVFLFVLAASSVASLAEDPPNLVIIYTDEHNFRTLGCYRKLLPKAQAEIWGEGNIVETPHIDSIADAGAICTSFYATSPVCSPSRGSFISGLYPQNTPVTSNNIKLDDDIVTFAELLRRKGYKTSFIGKWHLDGDGKPQWEPERNFGFEDNRYMFNRGHWKKFEDTPDGPRVGARDKNGKPSYSVDGADEESFATDWLSNKTIDFIDANAGKEPFCVMLSLPDPHGPDTVRAPYDTRFNHMKFDPPESFKKDPTLAPLWGRPDSKFLNMSNYFGMVQCIDDNVGRILAALDKHGIRENTVIVFSSDHGDLRGEHQRQNKGVPFEASARIPFLLAYPPVVKPGTVINEALGCVDFLPTALNLMGVDYEEKVEGRDASALFSKGKAPEGWEDITFVRATSGSWLSAISDRHKLVISISDDPWLFDLERDPNELQNFFEDPAYREEGRRLAKALLAYGRQYNDPAITKEQFVADLTWLLEGEGEYTPPKRPAAKKPNPLREKLKKGKAKEKTETS